MNKDNIIKLNIDGFKYTTSRETLTTFPDSMLARLILGKIPTTKIHGRIFIDRDGEIFNYILNYLRNTNIWVLPENKDLVNRINIEAQYYCLDNLVKITTVKKTKINPRIKLWNEYRIITVTTILINGKNILKIKPSEFMENLVILKNKKFRHENKTFVRYSFNKLILLLYKKGYDMYLGSDGINEIYKEYYFRCRN